MVWPERRLLAVADMHFEKGSAYGAMGTFLPPYDSRANLQSLQSVLERHQPETVVCLGDSFHDVSAGERMATSDRAALATLIGGRDWVWITGNHDTYLPSGLTGAVVPSFEMGPLHFRHEAVASIGYGEISGHFHPKARIRLRGRTLSCRCFATDGRRLILPAFGAYAGGLNVLDPALGAVLGKQLVVYALRNGAVHTVGRRSLVVEPEPAWRHCSSASASAGRRMSHWRQVLLISV